MEFMRQLGQQATSPQHHWTGRLMAATTTSKQKRQLLQAIYGDPMMEALAVPLAHLQVQVLEEMVSVVTLGVAEIDQHQLFRVGRWAVDE